MFIKIFTLGIKRLDATADDYATNISRNRVSFNICESDERDQRGLAKLSSFNSKKMSNTSRSEVLFLSLSKNCPVTYKNIDCLSLKHLMNFLFLC